MISMKRIEEGIEHAFVATCTDFQNNLIEVEQDFRACFYFHLRKEIQDNGIQILLDHNPTVFEETILPDLTIIRGGDYAVAIEMKNVNYVYSAADEDFVLRDYNAKNGRLDINKLALYKSDFTKGYFIHITLNEKHLYSTEHPPQWMYDGFFRELCYCLETEERYLVRFDKTKYVKLHI